MDSSFYFTSFKILKNFTNLLGGNKEGRKEGRNDKRRDKRNVRKEIKKRRKN